MPVEGRDKTFPERMTTKKQRSPMAVLSGIFKERIGILQDLTSFLFYSHDQEYTYF